jgi:hypothetical protein
MVVQMRIGIVDPFAYRPHVGHMVFLVRQLERLKHQIYYLHCEGGLSACNPKVNKHGIGKQIECIKCRIGGITSYLDVRPARLDLPVRVDQKAAELGSAMAYSTVATALQVEHVSEAGALDFLTLQRSLSVSVATAFLNARKWIRENNLDCVFVFNGRFDLTRATIEACISESVRFVSVERSWFGLGLQLLPNESCLGIANFHEFSQRWADKPLTREQALKASQLIKRRLTRTSVGEWRQFNVGSTAKYQETSIKYLFLPSSQHEWLGLPARASGWHHPTEGIEYFFGKLGLDMKDLVVRGHPAWAMKIKRYGHNRANGFYSEWCRRVGAAYIDSKETFDTHGLIRLSDVVMVNGSSASMEAAWRGRRLISFVPSAFTAGGFTLNLFGRQDVDALDQAVAQSLADPSTRLIDAAAQCRLALRFIYCVNYRLMQFVASVKSTSPYSFLVADPPDLSGLESLVTKGILKEEDDRYALNDSEEQQVVDSILFEPDKPTSLDPAPVMARDWAPVSRRPAYRWIDALFTPKVT